MSNRAVTLTSVYSKRSWRLVFTSFLLTCHQIGELLVPVTIGWLIDLMTRNVGWPGVITGLIVLALVFVFLSSSYRFGSRVGTRLALDVEHAQRMRVIDVALSERAPAASTGDVLTLATSDAARVGAFTTYLARGVAAFGLVIFALWNLISASLAMALTIIIGAPLLLAALALLAKRLETQSEAEQESAAAATSLASDFLSGVRVLRGIGAAREAAGRYRAKSQEAQRHAVRAASTLSALEGITVAANGVYLAIIACVGALIALDSQLSVGQLVASLGIATLMLEPLQTLAILPGLAARSRASAKRIDAYLRSQLQASLADAHEGLPSDFSVLPGLPAAGMIGIVDDGTEPGRAEGLQLALAAKQRASGIATLSVPHESTLFDVPLIDNVFLKTEQLSPNKPPLTQAETARLDAIADSAQLSDVLNSLPDGWASPLGEQGHALSGGQRQRVVLARALAAASRSLIMNNPMSALDSVTEADVAAKLRSEAQDALLVVVTASQVTLSQCQRVFFEDPEQGWITGTHSELLDIGEYRRTVSQ